MEILWLPRDAKYPRDNPASFRVFPATLCLQCEMLQLGIIRSEEREDDELWGATVNWRGVRSDTSKDT